MARLSLLGAAVALLIAARIDAARFVPLGAPPNAVNPLSRVTDISADGKTIIGYIYSGNQQGVYRWTEVEGMQIIDGPPDARPIHARRISGNGKVIIGNLDSGHAYRWTAEGGVELISHRYDGTQAISYDGSIIHPRPNYFHPFGGDINDTSWDGNTIVGGAFDEGFRDKDGIRSWLGDLPGGTYNSEAFAVSPDGEVAVGYSNGTIDGQQVAADLPIYWSEGTGLVRLGDVTNGHARDISQSKIVIVGHGKPNLGVEEAFRWTPSTGTRSVRELLLTQGIDVAALGWSLDWPWNTVVSANGRFIAGSGAKSGQGEAWLVELDVPGDFDADGDSDGNDFLEWQRGLGSTYDASDLADWRANIEFSMNLQSSASATATSAVPEPSALIAVAVPALLTLTMRRRVHLARKRFRL
jgi:uncharacterized membrane protein